jgi:hypothetical protein
MKILLAIPHFFRPEPEADYASTDAATRQQRREVVRRAIMGWRGHFGRAAVLNVERKRFDSLERETLDITAFVVGDDHLLDDGFCQEWNVDRQPVQVDNPRLLGFAARRLFAGRRNDYDLFVFAEDDLAPREAGLLRKIVSFTEAFGPRRLAMPNRYEWNPRGPALATYIDGDLRPGMIGPRIEAIPDEEWLRQPFGASSILFRRALNPHSGFYALTREQLLHWIAQDHFIDFDCSFVSPLESAATLGVLKTFSIYKPHGPDMGWIEVEHLDHRYSGLDLPRAGVTGGGSAEGNG